MSKAQNKEKMLARIASLEAKVRAAGADEDLKSEADELQAMGKEIAQESTGVDAAGAADDQNARANANWPMSFNSRMKAASSMVKLARRDAKTAARMLAMAKSVRSADGDVEVEDDETCAGCKAASKLVAMAVKRTKSASSMMKMARKMVKADDVEEMEDTEAVTLGDDIACASDNAKIASRLVAIAKNMMAEDDEAEEVVEDDVKVVASKNDSGKAVAAALVSLAKSLTNDKA